MNVTDYTNRAFSEVYHCSTTVNQAVYANPRDDAPLEVVSIMKWAPDVWVICQLKGRRTPVVQGRRSDWWFYTEGDAPNRPNRYGYAQAWAFLPATVVSQARTGPAGVQRAHVPAELRRAWSRGGVLSGVPR
jgi:hypothetical protein